MKALVCGAGAAGLLHTLAYRACGVEVIAVFDPDREKAATLAGICGAKVASSFEALRDTPAEIVSVCSPPREHVAQCEALSGGGRVVLVEKPVALTEEELARLRRLPRCVPVAQWRAGRALRALRRAIAHGELGTMPFASCDLAWSRDEAYLAVRGGSAWGCGAALSIGIHAIDALTWALGQRIEGVAGITSQREGATYATAALGLFRFSGGASATLRISIDGGADATRIAICGRGISAVIQGGEADPTASVIEWAAVEPTRTRLLSLERDTPGALGPPLLVPYIGGVVAALREGFSPGETERLPSIDGMADAHLALMRLEALSRRFHGVERDDSRAAPDAVHRCGPP